MPSEFKGRDFRSEPIRSFGTRRGHVTQKQQAAIDELLPKYGVPYAHQTLNTVEVFGNDNPLVLEIGCGMGETSALIAQRNRGINFLGIEVYPAGVGSLLSLIDELSLSNLRVIQHDAVQVLSDMIAPESLRGANIFFPDPWPKKRHHKRRLIQAPFVGLLASRLRAGASIHCATDWESYALQMLEVLSAEPSLINTTDKGFVERPESRPVTKFERRGLKLGHQVWDLIFVKA